VRQSVGGTFLGTFLELLKLRTHLNQPEATKHTRQPKPPAVRQSVGGTFLDRWVAPFEI
jgi:hypothetical protein